MKKILKKYSTQIIVLFLVLIILELIFIFGLKYYPFKTANILVTDLYGQYVPFFNYMRDSILNGRSIFASFSFSMGQSTVGILSYYCLSPLNLILLFSNSNNIVYFIKVLLFAKIILCGLSMSIYLNNKTDRLKNIAFSIIYAFITYNIKYGFNIMWLDIVYMLPLVILGLEKFIEGNSPRIYIITLTIMIFANFYIAFGACLFILIYFLFYAFIKKKLNFKLCYKFAWYSIIPVLLNAFVLIPTFFNMIDGKVLTAPTSYDKFILYNPIYAIYNIAPGITIDTITGDKLQLPYFYASTLVLVLFVNYLFNREIEFRERFLSFLIVFFIICVTLFAPLDLLFHCFRVPNNFFYRYIYILPFFLISVVSRNKIKISWYSLIPLAMIIIWALTIEQSIKMMIFGLLIILYFFLEKTSLKILVFITIILEIIYNLFAIIVIYNGLGNYNDTYEKWKLLEKHVPKENEFYRVEMNQTNMKNTGFLLGYYGVNSFSPTMINTAKSFLKNYLLTFDKKEISYIYKNRFILDPYFLGIKYEVSNGKLIENKYYLPLVVMVNNFDYFKPADSLIENANNLYKMINGEYLFKEIDFKIDCLDNNKVITKKCNIKYDKKAGYNYYISVIADNGTVFILNKYSGKNTIIEVDETFNFDYDNGYIKSIKLYEFNESNIKNQTNDFEIFRDDYMRLKVDKGKYLLMLPYDDGWHIRVDGNEIEKFKVLDSLIGFETDGGLVEIEFIPRGLMSGIIVSGMTISLIVTYLIRKRSGDL